MKQQNQLELNERKKKEQISMNKQFVKCVREQVNICMWYSRVVNRMFISHRIYDKNLDKQYFVALWICLFKMFDRENHIST